MLLLPRKYLSLNHFPPKYSCCLTLFDFSFCHLIGLAVLKEYVPDAYMRRKFLTGFGGSAGTAVVGHDEALLWTDSRYWNEASLQLDSDLWTLMKQGEPKVPTIVKYLTEKAIKLNKDDGNESKDKTARKLKVGIDPYVHPASFAKDFNDAMEEGAKSDLDDGELSIGELVKLEANLIDPIWGEFRPPVPYNPWRVHPLEYAGVSVVDKVEKIRKEMTTKKATMAVFCTLDDVAYLMNLRCQGDVDTCPVGIAYATVTDDAVTLYCDSRKLEPVDVQEHLSSSGVTIKPYDDIVSDIISHATTEVSKNKVWIDKSRANLALVAGIPEKVLIDSQNAITPMKAQKNSAEMEGMRRAHIADGAAMANFMAWLEETVVVQGRAVSEVEIDEVLTGFRAKQPGFVEWYVCFNVSVVSLSCRLAA
jgi:Xaa-Pro aminopeptidase